MNSVSFWEGMAKIGERRPLRKWERQSGDCCVYFATYSQSTDNVLLHMRFSLRRVGIPVPTNGFTVCDARHFWVGREQIGERVNIYNKVREPNGSLLFHVKQKPVDLPIVSCKTGDMLCFT